MIPFFFLWDKINVFPLDSIIDTELLLLLQRGTHHSSYSAALLWTQQQQQRRQQEGYEEVILPPDCSRIHEHWGAAAAVKRLTWALSTQTRLFTRRTALCFSASLLLHQGQKPAGRYADPWATLWAADRFSITVGRRDEMSAVTGRSCVVTSRAEERRITPNEIIRASVA